MLVTQDLRLLTSLLNASMTVQLLGWQRVDVCVEYVDLLKLFLLTLLLPLPECSDHLPCLLYDCWDGRACTRRARRTSSFGVLYPIYVRFGHAFPIANK